MNILESNNLITQLLEAASEVRIVRYETHDYRLLRLFNRYRERTAETYSRGESIESALDRFTPKYVAFQGRKIVGAVAFSRQEDAVLHCSSGNGIIELPLTLYVSSLGSLLPGVGRQLIRAVEKEALEMKAAVSMAFTSGSKGFYNHLGYEILGGVAVKRFSGTTTNGLAGPQSKALVSS
jgi:predicted N-acetyltransferase YhbS